MRATRFYGPSKSLSIEDVEKPRASPGEVAIRVKAAGICHMELHFLDGMLNLGIYPSRLATK